ncbi:MAG: glycosyltransferase family 2 protein [Bacteroidota bacterium]|jgi:glycosyltransferase involved in cell wall biosynthesis
MSADQPLVSIIMPTYNRAHLIGETIQSVIDQTYTNWELLVIDDGSEDGTEAVVTGFADSRILYDKLDHTGYIGKARNHGIKKSRGEYIAFLDSDDLWRPDKLEFQLKLLRQYPEARLIVSNGEQFGPGASQLPEKEVLFVGNLFRPQLANSRFCMLTSSWVFMKNVIEEIGLLDENTRTTRDIHYFYRMSYRFTGIFTNERLITIRKHDGNISTSANVQSHLNYLSMIEEFRDQKMISEKLFRNLRSTCYYKLGLLFLETEKPRDAFQSFQRYVSLVPLHWKGWARLAQVLWLRVAGR